MKQSSIRLEHSRLAGLLLLTGAFCACAAAGDDDWRNGFDTEQGTVELGSNDQAFSDVATLVTTAENLGTPFISAVKIGNGCSGVKIPALSGSSKVRILTAAHCISESSSSRTIAISNNTAGTLTNLTIPANRTFVHPSYQLGDPGLGQTNDNAFDVAFFELDSGATFAQTPTTFTIIPPSTSLMGIGYGDFGANCGSAGGAKRKATVQSASGGSRERAAHYILTLVDPTPCGGDSGGPLIFGTGANAKVVGVVSGHAEPSNTAFYTRLSSVLEWVNDPVDSTLASSLPRLIANNSGVYLMNGALVGSVPALGCAAMDGTGTVSGTDVRIHSCDDSSGTFTGNAPGWRLLTSPAGGFKIVNRLNGLCLGINVNPTGLTNVAAFTCATSGVALNRQSWLFEEVSGFAGSVAKAHRLRTVASTSFCLNAGAGGPNEDVVLSQCSTNPILDAHKWYLTR